MVNRFRKAAVLREIGEAGVAAAIGEVAGLGRAAGPEALSVVLAFAGPADQPERPFHSGDAAAQFNRSVLRRIPFRSIAFRSENRRALDEKTATVQRA